MKVECGFNVCRNSKTICYGLCTCKLGKHEFERHVTLGNILIKGRDEIWSVQKCNLYTGKLIPKTGKFFTVIVDDLRGTEIKLYLTSEGFKLHAARTLRINGKKVNQPVIVVDNGNFTYFYLNNKEIGYEHLSPGIDNEKWFIGRDKKYRIQLKVNSVITTLKGNLWVKKVSWQDTLK